MDGGWLAHGFDTPAKEEPEEKPEKRVRSCGVQRLVKQPTEAGKSGEAPTSYEKSPSAPAPAKGRHKDHP